MALALVLSLSHIPDDGRVLRQCRCLSQAGFEVLGVGLSRSDSSIGKVDGDTLHQHILCSAPSWSRQAKLAAGLRFLSARLFVSEERALSLASAIPGVDDLVERTLSSVKNVRARGARVDLLIANDWTSLPAAIAAHRQARVPFHYDTHELAVAEHWEQRRWRFLFPPVIAKIERLAFRHARSASCVSSGIAEYLAKSYRLTSLPAVVRNVPDSEPLAPTPVRELVTVLYHGLYKRNRGLQELLRSVTNWPNSFQLILRGRAPDRAFGQKLEALVHTLELVNRVSILDAVSQDQVVAAANNADIGVFLPDLSSPQNRFALPNKVFEYLHAGLMVIVPERTEMGDFVKKTGAGIAVESANAEKLATVLQSLSRETITRYKLAAHEAAKELRWSLEQRRLLRVLGLEASRSAPGR